MEKLCAALEKGFVGLRLTGNTFWLEDADWDGFTRYEEAVNRVIGRYKILAICTYSLQRCNAVEMLDVVANHQFALIKRSGRWEMVESARHRKTEQALRESEEKLSALYNSMVEGVALHEIVYDNAGKPADYIVTDVNPSYEEITGLSRNGALGRRASELYGTGEAPYLDVYARVASSGGPESFETYFEPIKKHYAISVFSSGPGRFATVFSDITKRKRIDEALLEKQEELEVQAEELEAQNEDLRANNEELAEATRKLQESEEKYRILTENTPGVIQRFDRNLRISYISPRVEDETGIPPEKFIGRTNEELGMPLELCTIWNELFHKVEASKKMQQLVFDFPGPKGAKTYLLRVIPELAPDGSVESYLGISTDITEQKQAEEALRESEERLSFVLENCHIGAWDMGIADHNTIRSPEHDRVYGYDGMLPEWTYEMFLEHVVPEDRARVDATYQDAIKNQSSWSLEFRIRRPDGQVRWIWAIGGHKHDADGAVRRVAGIVQDITERKRTEEALRRAKDELDSRVRERTAELSDAKEELECANEELRIQIEEHEQTEKELQKAKDAAEAAAEAKAAFLANMSHELRTPMNAVIGFSSHLMDDSLTPEQREYIDGIRRGGEALLAIISDILEFSRADQKRLELEHQPFSLRGCMDESLDMVAVQADKKGLKLASTIKYGTSDTIMGDHGRLRQVLVNLLNNAVKFTDTGEVTISVSSTAVAKGGCEFHFEVRDTGIGIPGDKLEQLFLPFTQLERTISLKRDGVGLGLSISKRLVELMGGRIWAESTPGQGTAFRFTIQTEAVHQDRLPDARKRPKAAAFESMSVQNPFKILVAEDNPSNQRVLVEMLRRMGYRVDAVADGKEVLQSLERQNYDLILMDVRMPEMDGITATRFIRQLQPERKTKIIAVTAYALEEDREVCLKAGMDGYIAKPVKMNELADILVKCRVQREAA